ncbi:MAG: pyrroline-5-carboxylate reductase [Thioalkalispiraceae bacterium]|jgi:pyrroline-5-carboxylate reductase
MLDTNIGFIGGGNMARSLIGGLISSGVKPTSIYAADKNNDTLAALASDFAIQTCTDNQQLVDNCSIIMLSVKPQVMKEVVTTLDIAAKTDVMFITVAAGIRVDSIQDWLGQQVAIVRAMPNTPALVQTGATALYANPSTSDEQKQAAESILRAVGLALWVEDESQMDAVTALSGSGPAYLFLVMEAMEEAGVKLGLKQETARLLAIQTAFGAARLALEIEESPATLRERVTSPGGTTEQALRVFAESELKSIFNQAMMAARDRATQLADELGK